MNNRLETPDIRYSFQIVNVREMDAELLSASEDWADRALAMLARGDSQRAIAAAVSKVLTLPAGEQHQMSAILVILSAIIDKEEQVQEAIKEIGMINLMENKVLGPMIKNALNEGYELGREEGREEGRELGREEGRDEGIEEGRERTLRKLLTDLLADRFGPLPNWATAQIQSAPAADLESWSRRILHTDRLEQVFE